MMGNTVGEQVVATHKDGAQPNRTPDEPAPPVVPGGTMPIFVLVISTIVLVVGGIAFLVSWLLGAFR
jgi:hypothetical protein